MLTTLALAVAGGAAFWAFLESAERAIVAQSVARREAAADRVQQRVSAELAVASKALDDIERALRVAAVSPDDPLAVEARLYSALLDLPSLSDLTLTRADGREFRWQVSVFRASAAPDSDVLTRRIRLEGGVLVSELRRRSSGERVFDAPFAREPTAPADPTVHATYSVTVAPANYGHAIWSDLAYSELDAALPLAERRVVLTVQKTIETTRGAPAGVLRVGLFARTIDGLPQLGVDDVDPGGPERVFLCDDEGRFVARLAPSDPIVPSRNDLRVAPAHVPPEVAAAIAHRDGGGDFEADGQRWLATFHVLAHTQGWRVGVVAPAAYYTRDLRALRDRFLVALAVLTLLALVLGAAALRPVRRSLLRVVDATARMRRFELAPAPTDAPLREVADVMQGVELAKTAMRSLGKYVPMDLVRDLHAANREPELGGELVDLSLMFTDIEGFTSLSERLAPDALAQALGRYLEAMTAGVRSTDGTVDKFIGDAVMAFWNAPHAASDHPARACRAALACLRATRALYASPGWEGLPPLVTRFGLHTARVMVGHFGAPERLAYTALGDGVNLAARLEGLCKQYGVVVLASDAIVKAAGPGFHVRRIDRVAVKGKRVAVDVYELMEEPSPAARTYEEALDAYLARDFVRALDLLRAHPDDPPSRVLAARCTVFARDPPPPDWDGTHVATSK